MFKKISLLIVTLVTIIGFSLNYKNVDAYTDNGITYDFIYDENYAYLIFADAYETNGDENVPLAYYHDDFYGDISNYLKVTIPFEYVEAEFYNINGDNYIFNSTNNEIYITPNPGFVDFDFGNDIFETDAIGILRFKLESDKSPILDGETAFVTNVDDPMTVDEIKSHLTAIDNEDGDISDLIQIDDDDYTPNSHKTGTYEIIYSVTDSAGNKSTLKVHVLIRDITKPVISGQSTYTQSMTTKLSLSTILSNLSVSDNYDTNLDIILTTDNYSDNYNKVGTHTINYKATDNSGNVGTYKVTINVIDDVKPSISGPTTIVKGQTETLTKNDILEQLSANDNNDGNITDKIIIKEDNYTGKGNITGDHTIIFEVSDNAGNKTTKTVTIQVKDDIPPVFYVDNYFITVEQTINLSQQDFIDLLTATGQIKINSTSTFTTILDEYTGNENKIGMYAMTFRTKSTDGNEEDVSVVINVTPEEDGGTIIEPEEEKEPNFFINIWNFITSIFIWLWNALIWCFDNIIIFFKWLLNLIK